jgi:hypothetical protein
MEEKKRNPKDIAGSKKLAMEIFPPVAHAQVVLALEDGAKKYGRYNWRETPITFSEYIAALERHIQLLKAGQDYASDSKKHHLAHIMATSAIVLDARSAGTLIDDRVVSADELEALINFYKGEGNSCQIQKPEKEVVTDGRQQSKRSEPGKPCVCGIWPTGDCDGGCGNKR